MTDTGMTNATTPFVQVRNLKMHFPVTDGVVIQTTVAQVKAVDGVSFDIAKGETLGLVDGNADGLVLGSVMHRPASSLLVACSGFVYLPAGHPPLSASHEATEHVVAVLQPAPLYHPVGQFAQWWQLDPHAVARSFLFKQSLVPVEYWPLPHP